MGLDRIVAKYITYAIAAGGYYYFYYYRLGKKLPRPSKKQGSFPFNSSVLSFLLVAVCLLIPIFIISAYNNNLFS